MDPSLREHLDRTTKQIAALWTSACERVMAQAVLRGATPETHILVTREWTAPNAPHPIQEAWVAPIEEAADDERRYPLARLEWEDDLSVRVHVVDAPPG